MGTEKTQDHGVIRRNPYGALELIVRGRRMLRVPRK